MIRTLIEATVAVALLATAFDLAERLGRVAMDALELLAP